MGAFELEKVLMGSKLSQEQLRSCGRGSVKSCLRTLEVLEFFMLSKAPARTIEISQALEIPNSSADEILRTLAATGYLNYDQVSKLYAPSYKIIANISAIEESFFGGGQVTELMNALRRETGATIFLTQQNDCWMESVAELHGSWTPPNSEPPYPSEMVFFDRRVWRPGTNFAAAMLAQQTNVAIIQLATRMQRLGLGPKEPSLMKNLVDGIAQTRGQGYALWRRNSVVPVDSIAMPLRVAAAVSPYAIGVVGDTLFNNDNDVRAMLSAMRSIIFQHNGARRTASGEGLH